MISVVLLSYREEENLRVLIPRIKKVMKKLGEPFDIVVVDTEKPLDNTKALCRKTGVKYINQKYPCYGGAFRTAIETVKGDKLLFLDSDGSHDPRFILRLYRCFMTGADIVIGSRYIKGGVTNDSPASIAMSKLLNTVYRVVIGVRAHDISGSFRMYNAEKIRKVRLECRNYEVLEEVILKMKLNDPQLVIKEVPIEFNKRMFGESKRRLIPFIIGYIKTMFRFIGMRVRNGLDKI